MKSPLTPLSLAVTALVPLAAPAATTFSGSVYVTAKDTALRLSAGAPLVFRPVGQLAENEPCIYLNPSIQFQEILGIGAALTDSSAETFAKLPAATQQEFLSAVFDPVKGNGYSFARTPIASCDFSSGSYAYVEDGDVDLKTFSVAHDERYRIPFIQRAIQAAGGQLTLFASPWSPPGWMKDNGHVLQGGKLKPEYRDAWARHYVKFVRAYEAHGIPIWGLTVQNEPLAKQRWESCLYTAEEERDFVRDHLGPVLHASGLGDRKLIAWDHNRDFIFHRASVLFSDPEAAKYIWGLGFHWYETWTGGPMQFENVGRVHEAWPDKALVFTEGCAESFKAERIHEWVLGERYGHSLINDFNTGTTAWCDWNVLLDETGGPNHVGNLCFAPVHADTRTGQLIYTNAHYYLGHFSKFVRPQAHRIAATSNRTRLQTTAFRNANGELVVVVMNATDEKLDYVVWIGNEAAPATSLPHSIATFVIRS